MTQSLREILKEVGPKLTSLGFIMECESSDGAVWRRDDGLQLVTFMDRYGDGFSVELLPQGKRIGGGYSAYILMQVLAPHRLTSLQATLVTRKSNKENIQHWWNEFCDFLNNEGQTVNLNPLPASVEAKYRNTARSKLKEMGLGENLD
jgi:hypothetical protein